MSATQTILGGVMLFTVATALIRSFAPEPLPMQVNSITYESGYVIQDRTNVTADPFYASWAAQVIDESTGEKVSNCYGEGSFAYAPGNKVVRLSLAEWVGSPDCVLAPGRYHLAAAWYWGGNQVGAESDVFEVTE